MSDPLAPSVPLTVEPLPRVRVWEEDDDGWWLVGELPGYEALDYSIADLDLGSWSMPLHEDSDGADLFTVESRRMTIDFRGWSTTWSIVPNPRSDDETKQPLRAVGGVSAFEVLGWEESWPDPDKDLNEQPVVAEDDTYPAPQGGIYKGPAETIIKRLVSKNLSRVAKIVVPPSEGRGSVVTEAPKFDKLSDRIPALARTGGVTVTIDLVPRGGPNSTRADLTLNVRVPEDLTRDVILTQAAKTIDSYDFQETPPTLTKARVAGGGTGGVDRIRQEVTTPASVAAAAKWGGHRAGSVEGPSSFDPDQLEQAGKEALLEGAATYALAITAADTEGQMALRDYPPGSIVTAAFGSTDAPTEIKDTVSVIEISVDLQEGITVKPTLGDPSLLNPDEDMSATVTLLQQAVRQQQRKK